MQSRLRTEVVPVPISAPVDPVSEPETIRVRRTTVDTNRSDIRARFVERADSASAYYNEDDDVYSETYEYEEIENTYDLIVNQNVKFRPYTVALTFDDGPSIITEKILDILKYHDVVATFCVIGNRIERYEDVLIRTHNEGHEIIGHSWNHRLFTSLSRDGVRYQLVRTNDEIYRVLGIIPAFHRPPYGGRNNTVIEVSEELDMAILAWSVDPRDWERGQTSEQIYNHIMNYIFDGSILLFHDVHDVTVIAIERIVPSLLAQGVTFVTASELLSESAYPIEGGRVFRHR